MIILVRANLIIILKAIEKMEYATGFNLKPTDRVGVAIAGHYSEPCDSVFFIPY